MIAVDTNILLRFVLRDDEAQFIKASAFLEERTSEDPAFVSLIVVAELAWVLRKQYGYGQADIGTLLSRLLDTEEILLEDHGSLSAIAAEAGAGDLADRLISYSARRAGCSHTVTFDLKAARLVPSMELLS